MLELATWNLLVIDSDILACLTWCSACRASTAWSSAPRKPNRPPGRALRFAAASEHLETSRDPVPSLERLVLVNRAAAWFQVEGTEGVYEAQVGDDTGQGCIEAGLIEDRN